MLSQVIKPPQSKHHHNVIHRYNFACCLLSLPRADTVDNSDGRVVFAPSANPTLVRADGLHNFGLGCGADDNRDFVRGKDNKLMFHLWRFDNMKSLPRLIEDVNVEKR